MNDATPSTLRTEVREWLRPWKLALLAIGMGWLLYGATHYNFSDWDVGISFIMGFMAYALAPWSIRALYQALRAPRCASPWRVLLALFFWWLTVDGVYVGYHASMGNQTVRWANFLASSALFVLAGAVWAWRGTVAEFVAQLRDEFAAGARRKP